MQSCLRGLALTSKLAKDGVDRIQHQNRGRAGSKPTGAIGILFQNHGVKFAGRCTRQRRGRGFACADHELVSLFGNGPAEDGHSDGQAQLDIHAMPEEDNDLWTCVIQRFELSNAGPSSGTIRALRSYVFG